MKPISFILALVLVGTTTELSVGEVKDGSKNAKREEFLIILEQGAIKSLTARESTQKNSQPVSDNAMKISCEKFLLSGHIDKNGKYQLQVQMTGNVQIAVKDMQLQADSVVLNVKTNRLQLQGYRK
jgi:lipopolysaccharide assembly outer membrane protein LptD (OstA)